MQSQINDVLENEVADSAKDAMLKAIDKTVYDQYTPLLYERRGANGGLKDYDNIQATAIQGWLEVENIALVNDGYGALNSGQALAPIIVTGEGYTYSGYGKPYEQSRDFIKETTEQLDKSQTVERALKDGLRKRGIECD